MAQDFDLNWLISVDDHVLEPAGVWQDRLPSKFRDTAPRLVADDTGEWWVYDGKRNATLGFSAVAGKRHEEFTPEPVSYDEMRPGCYDSAARVEDMNRAGILASLCFPSFPRFCGQVFLEAKDRDLALLCVQAYNDWMIEEWCGAAPDRYIPLIIVPLWDPVLAAHEIERSAAKGARAFCFSENPADLGLPTVHDPEGHWDPVWQACNDTQVVVAMHIGSSSLVMNMSPQSPPIVQLAWASAAKISGTMIEWLFSPALQKFADLKIVLSEGGIGWIPYYLERASQVVDTQKYWANQATFTLDPDTLTVKLAHRAGVDLMGLDVRQTFRDHIYGCFIDDLHGVKSIAEIGVDNVMIESDYPHSDSTWPNCISRARLQLAGLSDADTYKVLRGNAERLFHFTPATPPASVPVDVLTVT